MRTPTARSMHGRRTPSGISLNVALGSAVRERRAELGLRQSELAARAGIDHRVLSRLERGERPFRVAELVALAAAVQTTLPALYASAERRTAGAKDTAA